MIYYYGTVITFIVLAYSHIFSQKKNIYIQSHINNHEKKESYKFFYPPYI